MDIEEANPRGRGQLHRRRFGVEGHKTDSLRDHGVLSVLSLSGSFVLAVPADLERRICHAGLHAVPTCEVSELLLGLFMSSQIPLSATALIRDMKSITWLSRTSYLS